MKSNSKGKDSAVISGPQTQPTGKVAASTQAQTAAITPDNPPEATNLLPDLSQVQSQPN